MSKYVIPSTIIIIAVAVFFLFTSPRLESVQGAQAEVARYDAALNKADRLGVMRDNLLRQYGELDPEKVERLERLIPSHVDNVRLLLEIDEIASNYQMALRDVSFEQEGVGTEEFFEGQALASGGGYDSMQFSFTVSGTYDEFLQFVGDLEESLRLVDIESISLNTENSPYTITMTIRTYWLSE